MRKLRGALLGTFAIATFSSLFLYASYVRSAIAAEPVVGAASTEYVEKFVELIVVEALPQLDVKTEDVEESEGDSPDNSEDEVAPLTLEDEDVQSEVNTPTKTEPVTFNEPLEQHVEEKEAEKLTELKVVEDPLDPLPQLHYELLSVIEQEIHTRSNDARLQKNMNAYTLDEQLSEFARERSEDMLSRNYFSHTSPDGCGITCNFEASGYSTLVWGENIARYEPFNEITTRVVAEVFVEKWLKSSGHRENLLSEKYTHHGIGLAVHNDVVIATVIFATP